MNAEKQAQTLPRSILQHKHHKKPIPQKLNDLNRSNKTLSNDNNHPSQEKDKFKHLITKKDNTSTVRKSQTINSKFSKTPAAGIEKYTPQQVSKVLGSVDKGRPLKANQIQYIVGLLNELTLLQPAVIQYNLKTLQDNGALTNDVLVYMMRLLMKTSYKWSPKQMSVLLTTLYTLDKSKDCQTMCDPRHTLQTNVKDLNPYEIMFMQNTFNNDQTMTPQRFLYFTAFLERISNLNKKQADEYIKALKSRGVFTTKSISLIMKFMESTRNHWRAIKYEKLVDIFGKEEKKFKIQEHKQTNLKRSSLLSKSPRQVVHHQATEDFSEVMDYFLKGGPVNAQKLSAVDQFLNNLCKMDDDELLEYLVTLKRRHVINNDSCLYLKNLLQTHLVVQEADKRQMLQKTLNRFMDQCKILNSHHTHPSIRKYRLELESERKNASFSTISSELEEPSLKAADIDAVGSSNRNIKAFPVISSLANKSPHTRYIYLPKMSDKTKLKLQRAYDRLKVEIYLTKRLKYYQKIFRG